MCTYKTAGWSGEMRVEITGVKEREGSMQIEAGPADK